MAPQPAAPAAIVVQLPAGRARRELTVHRAAGLVLLTRVSTSKGVALSVSAEIPGVAGVRVTTVNGPLNRCISVGGRATCTRPQQACPMPAAGWHVTISKWSGPAGPVRISFRVGEAAPVAT